jgi:hypothetical protein
MFSNKNTPFKLDKQGQKEVESKLKSLLETCQIYHIPMFASVAIENNDKETKYNNIVYSSQAHQIVLQNDCIRKYMLIANGFEAVPARDAVSFDMEEVFGEDEQE